MEFEYRRPQVRPVVGHAVSGDEPGINVVGVHPRAGATGLLADMAQLSDRLEAAARRTDRRIGAALTCASATVRAARARLGCDLLVIDGASVPTDLPIVHVGGLRIDRMSRTVTQAGNRIRVSRTMFDLLSLLASEPTRVFSKLEIYRTIWGADRISPSSARALDSHVVRLRNALGGPPWLPRHRGVGVSLLPPDVTLAA